MRQRFLFVLALRPETTQVALNCRAERQAWFAWLVVAGGKPVCTYARSRGWKL